MKGRVMAFLRFWYEFVVGDDWSVAVAVIAALALTYATGTTAFPAWPVLPAVVAIVLPLSLWRVARRRQASSKHTH
jgi:membrane protein implicated in regulation of membrane protease activity